MNAAANPDFRKLWAAQAVSGVGARITRDGLPILAVAGLAATPGQLGLMAALASGATLILTLASGGRIDRTRRRPVLIGADLLRAAVLIALPLAAWLGAITLWQVFAAAILVAAASVVFDIADHAYLPSLIDRDQITDGNARLSATDSVAEVGGPALAGLLFQWLAGPIAVAVNAATYLVSAGLLLTIRKPEAQPRPEGPAPGWRADVAAGFKAAWREPLVRPLLLMTAAGGLFGAFFSALYVVFALRVLQLTPAMLGLTIAAGGIGALAGAALAQPMARRLGVGPAIFAASAGATLAALLIPLAPAEPGLGMAFLVAAQVFGDALAVAGVVLMASLRQTVLPAQLLGRVGASFHAVGGGMAVAGALIGGALGGLIGPREALYVAVAGLALSPLIALASPPLRCLREMHKPLSG
ncbi:MFS transporter [Phenylobacterium sp.]|uniref:MFS transporter n=1 Tax=Phenylobacterium sp. TaxID=1871053 RepID=UPI0039838B4B